MQELKEIELEIPASQHPITDMLQYEQDLIDAEAVKAHGHSVECLYKFTIAALGLTDTRDLRVIFFDAHDALQWDEGKDRYIVPMFEGESECCHRQPWEAIRTQQVQQFIGPVDFNYIEGNAEQLDCWQCVLFIKNSPILVQDEPCPEIRVNGITEEVAFMGAIYALKEMAYKNKWIEV